MNKNTIDRHKSEINLLIDTSAILYFKKIWDYSGISIFKVFEEIKAVAFVISDDVASELITGKNGMDIRILSDFLGHILNSESAMMPGWKENRFIIEENGELKYIVLNKISSTDYAQVMLCQEYNDLTLLTNDRKLLKSAMIILNGRATGIPGLLKRLIKIAPDNQKLRDLHDAANKIFIEKQAIH